MNSVLELNVNKNVDMVLRAGKIRLGTVIWMLFSRTVLFLIFQALFYMYFILGNSESPMQQSANWWPFSVTFANLVCVFLIDKLLKREGKGFRDIFEFQKGRILKDFLIMSGILLISFPIAYLPNILLGNALFGDYMQAINLFYRPLPMWAAWAGLIVFPITMPLGELTVYFGYVMPRLEALTKNKILSLALPVVMLSFQHIGAPLLFDVKFIIWRLLMFLPFALIIGLVIRWKPRLFPYILIGHFFIDLMTAVSILTISMAA